MEQTFDLNKMGLAPMTGEEMRETDGGSWYTVLGFAAAVATVLCTGGMALAAAGIGVCCAGLDS
jgi:hypothetical protein